MEFYDDIKCPTKEEVERAVQLRSTLLPRTQRQLAAKLENAFILLEYANIKRILDQGVDPNAFLTLDGSTMLERAICCRGHFVKLLLAYGADPKQRGSDGFLPIERACDMKTMQALVRAGARIMQDARCLCLRTDGFHGADLRTKVWALRNGANPNIVCRDPGCPGGHSYPIHELVKIGDLAGIIALVCYGADFAISNGWQETPVVLAQYRLESAMPSIEYEGIGFYSFGYEQQGRKFIRAIYELLKTLGEYKLNPHIVYTIDEYRAMGISQESAQLIQAATQQVDDEIVWCVQDDFEYGKQNMVQFVLDREIGKVNKNHICIRR